MKNEFGIEEEIYNKMLEIFEQIKEIKKVTLFGSRAKKTYKQTSDIDLAVELTEDSKKLSLIRELDEMRCALKFDVLNMKYVKNEQLLNDIKNEGIIIYNRD